MLVHMDAIGNSDCTAAKVRRLSRRVTQLYDDSLAPHGITIGQMGLLANLRRSKGVSISRLSEHLASDASTVSRLLKPLLKAGYLTLSPDPDDRRSKLVRLTQAGHEKRRDASADWLDAQEIMRLVLGDGRLVALRLLMDEAHDQLTNNDAITALSNRAEKQV